MTDPTDIASRRCPNCAANKQAREEAEEKLRNIEIIIMEGQRKIARIPKLVADITAVPPFLTAHLERWHGRRLFDE